MDTNQYPGQMVFGLDIGTRSIVGTVGYKSGNRFCVVAQQIKEHDTRAMLDGQIHDITKVGQTIKEVKEALESKIGRKLSAVCIAAAGRVLQTVTTVVEMEFTENKVVTSEDIYALDSAGVEKAYEEFQKNTMLDDKFYCVGYSVVHYYLNGYPMSNLENHKAHEISEELIATFLPDDVVDGLYRAVELAGLEVANLTLEPIAAIQVAIPENFRMLNIALVDVGAGTSDISITKDGSIIAYGMLPFAGDGLTEAIAQHCLVDFATAEQIKRGITEQEEVAYLDIMLLPQKVTKEEILRVISPIVETMAKQVADKIKELNGDKSVSAVFVVGGGGKIPTYTEKLAEELSIQKERVALRGKEVMQQIDFMEEGIEKDSILVTPIGICLNFYEQNNNFIYVTFNGERVKLYDNSKLAIVDAAMQAGFQKEALFPRRGRELNFTVDGKSKIVRGQLGEAAEIRLNGEKTDISKKIHANDVIEVKESTFGEPARIEVQKLQEYSASLRIIVNEKRVDLPKFASVNGELQSGYYEIQNNDRIEMLNYYSVGQIAEFMDVPIDIDMNLYVNNKSADSSTKVFENFTVTWGVENLYQQDVEEEDVVQYDEVNSFNDENVHTEKMTVVVNGQTIQMQGKENYVFVDIFDYVDFDLTKVKGNGIVTKRNGMTAQYMEPLEPQDIIEIFWKETE